MNNMTEETYKEWLDRMIAEHVISYGHKEFYPGGYFAGRIESMRDPVSGSITWAEKN